MTLKVGWSGWGREVRWPKREVQAARAGAWAGVGSGRREIFRVVVVVSSEVCLVMEVLLSSFPSRMGLFSESGGDGVVAIVVVAIDEIDVGSGDGWLCVVVDMFWSDDGMLWFDCSCSFSFRRSFFLFLFEGGGWSSDGEVLTFFLLTRSA